ncbi:hypothetical protein ES708_19917 [subsurface metagenome]
MTIASKPALFNSGPQYPPTSDSPNPFVKGDFAPTLFLPAPAIDTPVIGPVAKINLFSGPRGSMLGFNSFRR